MYLIRGIQNIDLFLSKHKDTELIATIGNFDGLHLGHQHIIENMQKDSEVNGWQKLVIFTEPHAREFFAESLGTYEEKPPRIFPWSQKVKRLKELGVEYSFFLNFNNQLRKMTPEDFINNILIKNKNLIITTGKKTPKIINEIKKKFDNLKVKFYENQTLMEIEYIVFYIFDTILLYFRKFPKVLCDKALERATIFHLDNNRNVHSGF